MARGTGRELAQGPSTETLISLSYEVESARSKFPGNRHLLAALQEEIGELAEAYLKKKPVSEVRSEAIQVACVALRIYEEGDSAFDDWQGEKLDHVFGVDDSLAGQASEICGKAYRDKP